MINIGAAGSSRSRSLEQPPPARMLVFSPCPERSWPRVRRLRLSGKGESPVVSPLAYAEPIAAPANGGHFAPPACPGEGKVRFRRTRTAARHNRAISSPLPCQITRHTMQSNFTRMLLKTNDGHPNKVTHKTRGESPEIEPTSKLRRTARESLATSHSSLASGLNFPNLAARGPHRTAFQEESYEIE
jgi:hypothetical protein